MSGRRDVPGPCGVLDYSAVAVGAHRCDLHTAMAREKLDLPWLVLHTRDSFASISTVQKAVLALSLGLSGRTLAEAANSTVSCR